MSYIVESSIVGCLLVGVILLIRLFLKEHMKKSIIYYLWFILIIKLLVPFGPESKLSLFNLINIKSKEETNLLVNNYKLPNEEISSETSNLISLPLDTRIDLNTEDNNIISNNEVENNESEINIKFSYKKILFVIWIVGIIIITSRILISYLKLKLSISKEYKKYRNYNFNVDIIRERKTLNIKRNIEIRITNQVNTPSLCGVLKPKILIPINMISNINKEDIRYIMLHELCHYKRKDVLVLWLAYIAKTVHWFNPIISLGVNIMRYDCESACDEMVLSKLNDKENIKYGNTLLNVLHLINIKNTIPGTTSMVTNKKRLKGRIKFIAENKKITYRTMLLGVITIVILSALVLTNKLTSENLSLVDSSKIKEASVSFMSSSPKGKNIYNKEDVNKIVKYINSIKVKDKTQGIYKGWEVKINLTGEENYEICFIDNYININGIQYTVNSKEIDKIRFLYDSLDYEERYIESNEVTDDGSENLNFHSVIKEIVNKNLEVKLIEEKSLSTKDNGYSAKSYTIKVNNEELKIYEYDDKMATLSEISLLNEEALSEIFYDTDYALIDKEELRNAKEVYFKDKIICLYNGNNDEIKNTLNSILEEPLASLSRDKLRISGQDITLIYPSNWIGIQEPIEIVIGEETYKIDSRFIKQNKNKCEVKINNDLLQKIRVFDEEKILIKWEYKIASEDNKIIVSEINRKDFIRVVKIQGGYIDISLVEPEIEIDISDKEEIGRKLYEEYIKMHSTNWFFNLSNGIDKEPELSVLESKINDVKLISEGKYIFTVDISYDIKAANEKSPWYAGNGVIEDNNWIRNKGTFLDIEKTGENKYRIISGYTG
ncbi:M56 family metallopeptidase [Clostridium nigeriense]|uniref:M56 family metallopeptidase n=1 Tax=Clostridium nigeriense TaxID=1805470 RepID=UPI003D3456C1